MKNVPGLIIAAPASGSGKTTLTLALLRALRRRGVAVASAKAGPDYIDPGFHSAASGRSCYNLDCWAMRPSTLASIIRRCGEGADLIIAEGVMGLYDGAPDGTGATADLAELTGWPVILVVDASGMAASAAAVVHGFASFRPGLRLAGVIFNRIGGPGHAKLLVEACAPLGIPVLGCLPRQEQLALPERHLGLVQAQEHPELEAFFATAADLIARHVALDAFIALARPAGSFLQPPQAATMILPALGQRIALAQDRAFAFCYPHVLDAWRNAGGETLPFSPLADEPPDPRADAVYLPGGYPELYAGKLASNQRFITGLTKMAVVYGECGGYMVLGRGLIDADGERHAMAGLLPVETSFAERQLHLGYRQLEIVADGPLGKAGARLRGHEFHFARLLAGEDEAPLFRASDARGQALGAVGARIGTVMGSFIHLVDSAT
jgi:cobyrinic acid a,c-diamide synthase